jgi:TatD DNase family protein
MFVDSHAHLEVEHFGLDQEQVIARAREAGVETILAIGTGTGPGSLDCAVQLAKRYAGIYATIGIHPHEAQLASAADYEELGKLARAPKVIAWGEIGLDYYYDHSPRAVQEQVFRSQMELAKSAKLPIVIHCRPSRDSEDAWQDCLELLRCEWAPTGLGGILHCFTGPASCAREGLDMGFMVSFAGNITFPKAQAIREAAKLVPLDRLLIETDSPFLAPVPHRGRRNEPAFLKETARQVGELHGLSGDEIGQRTGDNFYRFFSLHETLNSI